MNVPRAFVAYASRPERSRGRRYPEPESPTRSVFQRDRDRIIHCAAFRRLEYKTQVFVNHEGDHYRTRLTHSLEVAQIARSICRVLGLDEDLAEAVALAHDLGHTPFGHAGEEALDALMAPYGGFDHNAQTLRIVTRLEERYAGFDGLNLTWETLEGVVKHNGPIVAGEDGTPIPGAIVEYVAEHDLELGTWCGPEAQVAALADDIAYNNHDIDDGLRADLFDLDDLTAVPIAAEALAEVRAAYPGLARHRLINETVRRLIDRMVGDVLGETRRRVAAAGPVDAAAIRGLGRPVVAFSDEMAETLADLRGFLFERMYRHPHVKAMTGEARRVVTDLFTTLFEAPDKLPPEWRARAEGADTARRARQVADYIAGMTDRYAHRQHDELTK